VAAHPLPYGDERDADRRPSIRAAVEALRAAAGPVEESER
jgi:hypothetical protein